MTTGDEVVSPPDNADTGPSGGYAEATSHATTNVGENADTGQADAYAEATIDARAEASPEANTGSTDASSGLVCPRCSDIPAALACQIALEQMTIVQNPGPICSQACNFASCTATAGYCVLGYQAVMSTAQGVDAGYVCPDAGDTIQLCCMSVGGRLTEGIAPLGATTGAELGAVFAARAYLEAASVFAFERLERELVAHRAPQALVRAARRARRDEVRHTITQSKLARRYGARARTPEAPPQRTARPLFEVALENALEGCVRETYGAVSALVEAKRSTEPGFRRAMRSLAIDECRHAELAWEILIWARSQLSDDQNRAIAHAMRDAVAEVCHADPTVANAIAAVVWNHMPAAAQPAART